MALAPRLPKRFQLESFAISRHFRKFMWIVQGLQCLNIHLSIFTLNVSATCGFLCYRKMEIDEFSSSLHVGKIFERSVGTAPIYFPIMVAKETS